MSIFTVSPLTPAPGSPRTPLGPWCPRSPWKQRQWTHISVSSLFLRITQLWFRPEVNKSKCTNVLSVTSREHSEIKFRIKVLKVVVSYHSTSYPMSHKCLLETRLTFGPVNPSPSAPGFPCAPDGPWGPWDKTDRCFISAFTGFYFKTLKVKSEQAHVLWTDADQSHSLVVLVLRSQHDL